MKKELSEARFGVAAIQKGFVSLEQIIDALGVQIEENISSGTHRPLGQILVDQELIDCSQLEDVLQTIKRK
jgi:hypothetical protein